MRLRRRAERFHQYAHPRVNRGVGGCEVDTGQWNGVPRLTRDLTRGRHSSHFIQIKTHNPRRHGHIGRGQRLRYKVTGIESHRSQVLKHPRRKRRLGVRGASFDMDRKTGGSRVTFEQQLGEQALGDAVFADKNNRGLQACHS